MGACCCWLADDKGELSWENCLAGLMGLNLVYLFGLFMGVK